jgi:hypothetical protein
LGMKFPSLPKCSVFILITILWLSALLAPSCQQEQTVSTGKESAFGIYLLANDELVLSGNDIDSFNREDGTFALNAQGIDKWQSYFQKVEPKLKDSLFGQGFIIKVSDKAICSGTIWSMLSSASRQDIVLLDALSTSGGLKQNTLRLQTGYGGFESPVSPAIRSKIADYFNTR